MSKIIIKTQKEIERIRDCGAIVAETLAKAGEMCKAGVATQEIDDFVREFTLKNGAIPACLGYRGYPKSVCISVNDVVTHGIPGSYVLKDGDIVNIKRNVFCWQAGKKCKRTRWRFAPVPI